MTPKSVQEFSRKFMNERALVLSGDAGAAQVRFYESLLQLNREFVESLFARLERAGSIPSDEPLRIELTDATETASLAGVPVFRTARPAAAATSKKARSAGPKRKKKSPAKRPKKKAAR